MIKYDEKIKQQARSLRKSKGFSYKEISDKIGISKSTAKSWCRNITLNREQYKKLYIKQVSIITKGPNCSHERRKREIENITKAAEKEISLPISNQELKLFGAALYWAEGNKTKQFSITNSDPLLIKFMVNWFKSVFDIPPENIKAHLNIYPKQNEKSIKFFWSELTGIPFDNFGKSFIKPKSKNYKKNILYYGTIRIRVQKGTDFRYRVFSWIDYLLKDMQSEIDATERKWQKLKTSYSR